MTNKHAQVIRLINSLFDKCTEPHTIYIMSCLQTRAGNKSQKQIFIPLTLAKKINITSRHRGILMLGYKAYCIIPVSPPAFSYLLSSSYLPQFPKNNNNNNRMPSVNIIEV